MNCRSQHVQLKIQGYGPVRRRMQAMRATLTTTYQWQHIYLSLDEHKLDFYEQRDHVIPLATVAVSEFMSIGIERGVSARPVGHSYITQEDLINIVLRTKSHDEFIIRCVSRNYKATNLHYQSSQRTRLFNNLFIFLINTC